MKHRTVLTSDSREWGHTYTARCRTCAWTAPRLPLGPAADAALDHEAHPDQEMPS